MSSLSNSGTATAAEELSKALAALIPHVHTEDCPVCGRDYSEVAREPLSAHLAGRVSSLGARAEHVQELARARLEALSDLRKVQEERSTIGERRLDPDARVEAQFIFSLLKRAHARLVDLAPGVAEGGALVRKATEAERDLTVARDHDRASAELWAASGAVAASLGQAPPDSATPLGDMLAGLSNHVAARIEWFEERAGRRLACAQAVEQVAHGLELQRRLEQELVEEQKAAELSAASAKEVERRRSVMRELSSEAEKARVQIVRRVFTNSLNRAWRDLFVRLAPEEPFVPVFRVPRANEKVAATLETMHRDGKPGGPPGAMLSAGNVNTAALTLFLALNLSVERRLPWILLDDPVQSMDEVHIAQFSALLRTLATEHNRRVVIAVHDRALFDYLALELSPANTDDGLITVELSRAHDGSTSVHANFHPYVEDLAFATPESTA